MKAVMNIDVELRSCIEIPDDVAEAMKREDARLRFADIIKKQVVLDVMAVKVSVLRIMQIKIFRNWKSSWKVNLCPNRI